MANKVLVCRHYSDVLMGLCATQRLNDVKVGSLIDASKMSRQTFYNHFTGLDDLVCFTAARALTDVDHPLFDSRNILESYGFAFIHRAFFSQLPSLMGERSVRERQLRWLRRKSYARFAPAEMNAAERLRRMLQIDLFNTGSLEVAYTWMGGNCQISIDSVVGAVIEMMPAFMRVPAAAGATIIHDPMDYPR